MKPTTKKKKKRRKTTRKRQKTNNQGVRPPRRGLLIEQTTLLTRKEGSAHPTPKTEMARSTHVDTPSKRGMPESPNEGKGRKKRNTTLEATQGQTDVLFGQLP